MYFFYTLFVLYVYPASTAGESPIFLCLEAVFTGSELCHTLIFKIRLFIVNYQTYRKLFLANKILLYFRAGLKETTLLSLHYCEYLINKFKHY